MTTNFSIDIETLSVEDSAVVLSIAVIAWNPDVDNEDPYVSSLNINMSPIYQIGDGRTMSKSALFFWKNQPWNVWEEALKTPYIDYKDGVRAFISFLKKFEITQESTIWARGNMDQRVLEHLISTSDIEIPWRYNQWRDARSFCDELYKLGIKIEKSQSGAPHIAMNDAMNMTYDIFNLMKKINKH